MSIIKRQWATTESGNAGLVNALPGEKCSGSICHSLWVSHKAERTKQNNHHEASSLAGNHTSQNKANQIKRPQGLCGGKFGLALGDNSAQTGLGSC